MERILDILEAELKSAKEQFEPLRKKIKQLEKEIIRYKLDNGLYRPMSELMNYKGKDLNSITLVEREKDGTLDIDFIDNDEFLEIDDNGHLYYSSYSGGVMEYNDKVEKYVHMYYGCPTHHDYIGFLDISVCDK